jgi:hypothetical protein
MAIQYCHPALVAGSGWMPQQVRHDKKLWIAALPLVARNDGVKCHTNTCFKNAMVSSSPSASMP